MTTSRSIRFELDTIAQRLTKLRSQHSALGQTRYDLESRRDSLLLAAKDQADGQNVISNIAGTGVLVTRSGDTVNLSANGGQAAQEQDPTDTPLMDVPGFEGQMWFLRQVNSTVGYINPEDPNKAEKQARKFTPYLIEVWGRICLAGGIE